MYYEHSYCIERRSGPPSDCRCVCWWGTVPWEPLAHDWWPWTPAQQTDGVAPTRVRDSKCGNLLQYTAWGGDGGREREGGGRNQAREHLGICMKRRVLWGEKLRVKWKRRGRVYTGSSHKNYLFTIPRGHSGTHLPHWRSEYSGYKYCCLLVHIHGAIELEEEW